MRPWWLLAAALVLLSPGDGDVGELLPVELLYIDVAAGAVRVETDTGLLGLGPDLDAALADLEGAAPGRVFLETADYLVVTEAARPLLPRLASTLRPATQVCLGVGADAQAAAYLAHHSPGRTLNDIRAGRTELPVLTRTEERYHLGPQADHR